MEKVALGQVSPAHLHSTNCSTITITYHLGLVQWTNSGSSTKWTQSHPTKNNDKIIEISFVNWAQLTRLLPEDGAQSSLRNVVLVKTINNCITVPSSQTSRFYLSGIV
jgi:hypothetical protein